MPRTRSRRPAPQKFLEALQRSRDPLVNEKPRKARIKGTFAAAGEARPEPSTSEPASTGQELAKQAEERFAVRHKRDGIDAAQHSKLLDDKPGRQSTKELAALAGRYVNFTASAAENVCQPVSARDEHMKQWLNMLVDIRKLAASVLGQVNE